MPHHMGGPVTSYYTDDPGNQGRGPGYYFKKQGKYHYKGRQAPQQDNIEVRPDIRAKGQSSLSDFLIGKESSN